VNTASASSLPSGSERLRIGGLTRWTSIDFPGRLAAVVFLQGCPWRCGYCHNPELLDATQEGRLSWAEVRDFLLARRGLLDGVVFSGGEPTLQSGLGEALDEVRAMGFETGLHTGGMYPERLAGLLPRLDWVGLDIKGPWERIDEITGTRGCAPRVKASLCHLIDSGVAFECRTTWGEGLFAVPELHALSEQLASLGVRHWALQQCRGVAGAAPPAPQEIAAFSARFERFAFRAS
jgi:pyruvate formate lyase activating enzyme